MPRRFDRRFCHFRWRRTTTAVKRSLSQSKVVSLHDIQALWSPGDLGFWREFETVGSAFVAMRIPSPVSGHRNKKLHPASYAGFDRERAVANSALTPEWSGSLLLLPAFLPHSKFVATVNDRQGWLLRTNSETWYKFGRCRPPIMQVPRAVANSALS